ncbi:hypothetical protein SAMN06265380_10174 [Ruegeria faecimaris]|uniref:Uncharacterized protein n=1 Tax=Ruegeria faecimaris TaxID=686389 RepID=A0A521AEI3_9RHOB|nr:hypothetical protein SAMN06265380_10174 [Ruegeria faecimaris]
MSADFPFHWYLPITGANKMDELLPSIPYLDTQQFVLWRVAK